MGPITFGTQPQSCEKLFATNSTLNATLARPAATHVIPVVGNGVYFPYPRTGPGGSNVGLSFFGTRTNADNETMTAGIYGLKRAGNLWRATTLMLLAITQGAYVGMSGELVGLMEYFADTITASTNNMTSGYQIISPTDDSVAFVYLDKLNFDAVQIITKLGTNASCNVLASSF